ncbi:hypothetical protein AALA22_11755 [Anaerovoracaceae bacterium 41-7]
MSIGVKNAGGGGAKVTIDGQKIKNELTMESSIVDIELCLANSSVLSSSFFRYNGEIHQIKRDQGTHYKCNLDGTMTKISDLPMKINIVATMYKGKLYALNSFGGNYKTIYEFDDNDLSWKEALEVPYGYAGNLGVCGDRLHAYSSSQSTYNYNHYIYENGSWTKASSLVVGTRSVPFEYEGELYTAFGTYGDTQNQKVYKYDYDNDRWISLSTQNKASGLFYFGGTYKGKAYFGDVNSSKPAALVYDIKNNSWSELALKSKPIQGDNRISDNMSLICCGSDARIRRVNAKVYLEVEDDTNK